jgi:excisionase family DNA binding protein
MTRRKLTLVPEPQPRSGDQTSANMPASPASSGDVHEAIAALFEHLATEVRKLAGCRGNSLDHLAEAMAHGVDVENATTVPAPGAKPAKPSALLTAQETADLLRIHVRTLRQRWRAGELPAPIWVGKGHRWRRRDVESWINEQVAR